MLGLLIILGHLVGGASGFFLWFLDAILVTYPFLFLLSTTLWGTILTLIALKLSKNNHSFVKHWLLMMLSIHWFTIALLMIDTFSVFNDF
ncbi:hypothetical protein ACFFMO_05790 [Lederbergia wuyishanensis]